MLDLTRRAALPPPRTNRRLLDYEVDFLWTRERLVVEVDGYAYHGSQHAFAQDRRRDAALTAAGYRVVRITWDDLSNRPEATAVLIARALLRAERTAEP